MFDSVITDRLNVAKSVISSSCNRFFQIDTSDRQRSDESRKRTSNEDQYLRLRPSVDPTLRN